MTKLLGIDVETSGARWIAIDEAGRDGCPPAALATSWLVGTASAGLVESAGPVGSRRKGKAELAFRWVYPIGGTLAKCDPFGTPSTSHWTGVAIIAKCSRTKTYIVTRRRTSTRPMLSSLAG